MFWKKRLKKTVLLGIIAAFVFSSTPAFADEIVGHRNGKDIYQDSKTGRYYTKEWVTVMETRYRDVQKSRTAYKTVSYTEYYTVPVTKYRTETYYVDVKKSREVPYTVKVKKTKQVPYEVKVKKTKQVKYWGQVGSKPVYGRKMVCGNFWYPETSWFDKGTGKVCHYESYVKRWEPIYGWKWRTETYYVYETRYKTETYYVNETRYKTEYYTVKEPRTRKVPYTDYETRSRTAYKQVPYTEYYTVTESYQVPVQVLKNIEYTPEVVVTAPAEISLDKTKNVNANQLKEKNKKKIFGANILKQIEDELDRGIFSIDPNKHHNKWYHEWQSKVAQVKAEWMKQR